MPRSTRKGATAGLLRELRKRLAGAYMQYEKSVEKSCTSKYVIHDGVFQALLKEKNRHAGEDS